MIQESVVLFEYKHCWDHQHKPNDRESETHLVVNWLDITHYFPFYLNLFFIAIVWP